MDVTSVFGYSTETQYGILQGIINARFYYLILFIRTPV